MKTALITGVSGGIGKAIATEFIETGYFVIGQYNSNKESVDQFVAELKCKNLNENFFAIKCDLSDSQDVKNMMDTIENSFKSLSTK